LKILGDILKSRCTTGINLTGGKFATGINDTGGKNFSTSFASVVDTGAVANLPPVSAILVANLSPVSTTPVATGINNTGVKFASGVNDTGANNGNNYQTADKLK
jgi:hypothetical protein